MTAQDSWSLNYGLFVGDGVSAKDEAAAFYQLVDEQERKLGSYYNGIMTNQRIRGMSIVLVYQQAMSYYSRSFLDIGKLMGEAKACGDIEKLNYLEGYVASHHVPMSSNHLLAMLNSLDENDRNAVNLALSTAECVVRPKGNAA